MEETDHPIVVVACIFLVFFFILLNLTTPLGTSAEYKTALTPTPIKIIPLPTKTPTPTIIKTKKIPTPTKAPVQPGKSWTGSVSHYSRAGCLGCSPNMTMANGQPLDDSRPTIAFNWLPMNTRVMVTNLDNGKSIEAVVTDTGGFNNLGPNGRIADLTPAVANYLGTRTDITRVKIDVL